MIANLVVAVAWGFAAFVFWPYDWRGRRRFFD